MAYEIEQTDGGLFRLSQVQRVFVAEFADAALADEVVRLLEGGDRPAEPLPETAAAPQTIIPPKPEPTVDPNAVAEGVAAAFAPAKAEGPAEIDAPAEPDWTHGYELIKGGASVTDAAASIGATMFQMRAKWAAHRKRQAKSGEILQAPDEARCEICDKVFLPSPDRIDRCARCAEA